MIRLSPKQVTANKLAREYRLNIWEGAVRSGKTFDSIMAWARFVVHAPAGALLMVGKTERTLQRNIIDPMTELFGPKRCSYNAGRGELTLCGRTIYVVGANDERSSDKIRGLTLAGFYVDELSVIPESFWSMLLSRISIEGAKGFATTNPDSPNHWLKRDYLDKARVWLDGAGVVRQEAERDTLDLARFTFKLTDNETLPAEYLTAIEQQYTGLWRRRFIDGEWVIAEGAVYESFDPSTHVLRGPVPRVDRVVCVGIDHGTTNPFAAIALGLTPVGDLVAISEWRWDPARQNRKLTDAEFSTHVQTWLRTLPHTPEIMAVDPAAESFKQQLWRDQVGQLPTNAKNAVLDGIRMVSSLLANRQLYVHESCTGLLDELPGYSWDDKAAEKGEDKPVKLNDHSCDALRYAVFTSQVKWRNYLRKVR